MTAATADDLGLGYRSLMALAAETAREIDITRCRVIAAENADDYAMQVRWLRILRDRRDALTRSAILLHAAAQDAPRRVAPACPPVGLPES